jgi:hypothetical protein
MRTEPHSTPDRARHHSSSEPGSGRGRVDRCRLLYLVGELHTGGLERQLYYLLRAMDRQRYRPAVVVWNYRPDDVHVQPIRALGVPLYWFPSDWSSAAKLRAFRRLVKQLAPRLSTQGTFYTNFCGARGHHRTSRRGRWLRAGRFRFLPAGVRSPGGSAERPLATQPDLQQFGGDRERPPLHWHVRARQFYLVRNGLDLAGFATRPLRDDGPTSILGVGYLLPAKRWDRPDSASQSALKRRGCRVHDSDRRRRPLALLAAAAGP